MTDAWSPTAARGRRPLVFRLAAPLAVAVIVVLLLVGLVVNRVVSQNFEATLTEQQQARLALATDSLAALVQLPQRRGIEARIQRTLREIARQSGGRATLLGEAGEVLGQFGRLPPAAGSTRLEEPLIADGQRLGTLVIELPSAPPAQAGFLRAFNTTLLIAGAAVIVVLVGLSAVLTDRLTRPLREVAAAARRLGGGELSARASGGPDAESAELAEAFNAMAGRLERSEMLRRRAASDMAHDLATPATLLESQLQAMVDGVVPADREQLDRARAAAGALSGVIVQLGELASAEAAPLQARAEQMEVWTALGEVQRSLAAMSRERGVTVHVTAPDTLHVLADANHFQRALRNVVTNAVQHTRSGGTVAITAAAAGDRVEIRVRDEGPGIAEADLPHIFERFYRADRARGGAAQRSGSGIGLTIARELLAANGGSIAVESIGRAGTSFLISLPLT